MDHSSKRRLLAMLIAMSIPSCAERLALRVYTTSDGLPSSYIQKVAVDSRGLLWFCTRDGLSRFDGSRFITYSTQQGLPIPHVNHLLETREGVYWVATNGAGVSRFDPKGGASGRVLFTTFPMGDHPISNRVNVLYEDHRRRLWAGTDGGVFRLEEHQGKPVFQWLAATQQEDVPVTSFAEDRAGNLWVGTYSGILEIAPDDHVIHQPDEKAGKVLAVLHDRQGNLWFGFDTHGALVLSPNGSRRWFTARDGLAGQHVSALLERPDGHIWIGGDGLAEFDGTRLRTYTAENGLALVRRGGLSQDQDGNLWLITLAGAMRLAPSGFTSYGPADGLPSRVHSIHEDVSGDLVVSGVKPDGHVSIHRFDGKHFASVTPVLPAGALAVWPGNGVFRDRHNDWWLLTDQGLWRYPAMEPRRLANAKPTAIYDRRRGLRRDTVSALYEDRHGDLWIGCASGQIGGLTRWERGSNRFRDYSEADGVPARWNVATAFAEDRLGRLWVGFQFGGLALEDGDRFRTFTTQEGLHEAGVTALEFDQTGRLWVASTNGVTRVDDVYTARPRFSRLTVADGLSSNYVHCIVEDRWGRMYLGTARGIDRIDPRTSRIRHYDAADGLAGDFVNGAYRDRHGRLWFGTFQGLSRLEPRLEEELPAPPIWIDRIRLGGIAYPLAENGEKEISGLAVDADRNNVQIDFFSSGFRVGQTLRYQFKLDGADREWSTPGDQRTVHYASLSPGSYRFQVRAVNAEGAYSQSPAVVSFRVLSPFWLRWWFLALTAMALTTMLYALHRLRLERLIEVERLRRRIAADLHDDIGASLSRVAVLTEVVKRQVGEGNAEPTRRLSEIAETARGLVDSMGDIVWSVDPGRDDLHNVVMRVRQFATDILADRPIQWDLKAAEGLEKVKLNPDQRRHVYLILKEALTNIARHSESGSVSLRIHYDGSRLRAEIRDSGRGFDAGRTNGHGLENMRSRAACVGGVFSIDTSVGHGTLITLDVPVKRLGA